MAKNFDTDKLHVGTNLVSAPKIRFQMTLISRRLSDYEACPHRKVRNGYKSPTHTNIIYICPYLFRSCDVSRGGRAYRFVVKGSDSIGTYY